MQPKLWPYEWLVVTLIILLLASLSFVSMWRSIRLPFEVHDLPADQMQIQVNGAVESPGFYSVKKGAQLKDLLPTLSLLPDADAAALKPERKLRSGQTIVIPSRNIQIYVEGAVAYPGPLTIPKGSRIQDLVNYVEPLVNADLSFFKKKRKLKSEETILIPSIYK